MTVFEDVLAIQEGKETYILLGQTLVKVVIKSIVGDMVEVRPSDNSLPYGLLRMHIRNIVLATPQRWSPRGGQEDDHSGDETR
ncbi:MAG: hypothetical protein WA970_16200 [Gammaproteobacteria bacterium]|jgi:hypothetical protein